MNKRKLSLKKCGISSKRYKELCGFCEQYPEWKQELCSRTNTLKGEQITDIPCSDSAFTEKDGTYDLPVQRVELQKKCELIEQTAQQADASLYPYLIKSVCYEKPFAWLQAAEEIPCSRATFYDIKKYFFYLLNQKKKGETFLG